jgi:hypothetical protein
MKASRAALMVVGVNLVAVWAAAAAGGRAVATAPLAPPQAVAEEAAVGEARAAMLAAAGRLEAHARRDVAPALVRDPFRFGAESRRAESAAQPRSAPVDPAGIREDAPPPVEHEPDIVLQGMAESAEGETVVRTAILRAGSDLVLATIGTRIGDRYEVVALTAESVELEDMVEHVRRTWRMK